MIKTYIDGVLQATPIVLRHNQLIGLNDDVNFQHITATDRTKLNNLSGINTGDETASTIINKIGDGSKINSNYLPSYVDDVLEFANVASFPATGENGKIYIALDVNLTYRWGGSGYVEISPSIALGETSATAYRGDRGASAYAHSILTSGTNPHNTTFANIASKPTTIAGYGITDGVTLTGNETLTNKTLTSPVLNTSVTGTAVTTTGEANKLFKFGAIANTILHFLRIRKSSTTALNVQDDSSVDVLNVDSTNKIVTSYNHKITGLAGAGNRMVVANSNGDLSAISRLNTINVTGLSTFYQLTTMPNVTALSYIWRFTSSIGVATLESTHNLFIGNDILSQFLGCTVTEVTPNANFSFRLGDSVLEIGVSASSGEVYLKRNSGTVTDLTIERITQNI